MKEQDRAARFSAQVDNLLLAPGQQLSDAPLTDGDRELLDFARQVAMLDFSTQSRFRQRMRQPQGVNNVLLARHRFHALAAFGVTILLLIALVSFVTPVRAFAQDLLESLFARHSSTYIPAEPHEPAAGPTATAVPREDGVLDLTVAQAGALASFPVKQLTQIPAGYALSSVHYDEKHDKVTLLYLNDAGLGIVLHQEAEETAEPWLIGADGVIEAVAVNGVPAEYVRGTWQPGEPVPGSAAMVWTSDDPHQQLRWTENGVVYTLSTTVGQDVGLTQAGLIALAGSLK